MSQSANQKQQQQEAIAQLREIIKPGDTLYTILRHVSRSGMQREISVVTSEHRNIDYLVARALGDRIGKHDGVIVGGCGMDMGFHLVYNLSYALFPHGFGCIGEGCPSNDHSNGDRDYTPHYGGGHSWRPAPAHWHRDGGYAVRQQWL